MSNEPRLPLDGYEQGELVFTPPKPDLPYRLAALMQEHIVHEASMNDYYVGRAERDDMALDLANEWFNKGTYEPPEIAYDALVHWRRIYGRGVQGG